MAFDFKKEFKEFYLPASRPTIVTIPAMNYIISMIRLPDFVTEKDLQWAISEATRKKKADFSKVEFLRYDEGRCVQCMHIGSYDDEPATVLQVVHRHRKMFYHGDDS